MADNDHIRILGDCPHGIDQGLAFGNRRALYRAQANNPTPQSLYRRFKREPRAGARFKKERGQDLPLEQIEGVPLLQFLFKVSRRFDNRIDLPLRKLIPQK